MVNFLWFKIQDRNIVNRLEEALEVTGKILIQSPKDK